MALANDIVLWRQVGPISSSDDWSIGLWFDTAATDWDHGDLNDFCFNAHAQFQSKFWGAVTDPWRRQVSGSGDVSFSAAYLYDSSFTLKDQVEVPSTSSAGTGTAPHPAYCSAVFSLRTARFGRSYRGRVYLPATGGTVTPSSDTYTVLQQDADNFSSFLANTMAGGGTARTTVAGVFSRKLTTITPITFVELNDKPDTQRGRENKTLPAHSFTSAV